MIDKSIVIENEKLRDKIRELRFKIQWLVDRHLDLPEGVFIFPDGDVWERTKKS